MIAHVNGIDLFYEVTGQGEPLILVHGNGEDCSIFSEAVELLQEHFTCFLLDSRGHGRSSPVHHLSYNQMADDVIAFADLLGLERINFYGFSDGGIIGLIVGFRRPELVKRLMVSGANTHPYGVRERVYRELKRRARYDRDPKLLLMLYQPHISDQQLRRIRARTLVMAGSDDLVREGHTRHIAACIPGAWLWILPEEDHGSYIVNSPLIAELILDFCAQTWDAE